MSKIIFALSFLLPLTTFAHGPMMNFDSFNTGPQMMRYIEDQSLDEDIHEQMEDLMTKMMSGTLSESESQTLAGFMNQYPGPGSLMMNRLSGSNNWYNHMFASGSWFSLFPLTILIWLIVGLILIYKLLNPKK